jgi:hypothetical protein
MSTWETAAAATVLGATEGEAGGEAAGALVETVVFAVVVPTVGTAFWGSLPAEPL